MATESARSGSPLLVLRYSPFLTAWCPVFRFCENGLHIVQYTKGISNCTTVPQNILMKKFQNKNIAKPWTLYMPIFSSILARSLGIKGPQCRWRSAAKILIPSCFKRGGYNLCCWHGRHSQLSRCISKIYHIILRWVGASKNSPILNKKNTDQFTWIHTT